MTDYDAIILGAGGAGLMCAATAVQRGRRVVVIDHAEAATARPPWPRIGHFTTGRRGAARTVEQVAAAALIAYSRYVDPVTGERCEA